MLQQATADPRLRWRLLDTYRKVRVSLLWGAPYSPFPSQVRKLRWGGALSSFHSGCQGHWVGESHLQAEITSSTFVWSPFRA